MKPGRIYGYLFRVIPERAESSWIAFCPGVGGVYEEGATRQEAIRNAYEAACTILSERARNNEWLTQDTDDLKVVRKPPTMSALQQTDAAPESYLATVCQ